MKKLAKISAGLIALLVLVFRLFTQTGTHEYKISWLANTEPDMKEYRLYIWEGSDTTQSPFEPGVSGTTYEQYFVKVVPHTFGVDTIKTTYAAVQNGEWIQAAVAAVDTAGNISGVGVSNFVKKIDTQAPAPPKQVKVYN